MLAWCQTIRKEQEEGYVKVERDAFKADVSKLIVKKGLGRYDMDYYTFGEKIVLLLAAAGEQPRDGVHHLPRLHKIASNWQCIASDLVTPHKPFTARNLHMAASARSAYISKLIDYFYEQLPTPDQQAVFITNIFVWKDIIEELLPGSRSNWKAYYSSLDYELARRHSAPVATFRRFESIATDCKQLIELMKNAQVKRLPYRIPLIGVEPELFKRRGRCFTLHRGLFEVFDDEVAMLCKLALDIKPYNTDFPPFNVYAADLDKAFRQKWL
jgi:hypothetical protein